MTKLYLKYGISITFFLIVYFLLLKLIGLHEMPILSAFNGIIIGGGIFLAISEYKKNHSKFKYQKGFQAGLYSGFLGTILFAVFMGIYMFHLEPGFATAILDRWEANFNYGPFSLVVSVIVMGFATSFVLTLAFMQLLKDSWNPESAGHEMKDEPEEKI